MLGKERGGFTLMTKKALYRLLLVLVVGLPVVLAGAFAVAVILTPLPESNLPEATLIMDSAGQVIAQLSLQNRVQIPVSDMPQYLLDAVVSVEDDRFYQHRGLDPVGIGRALVRNLIAGEVVEGGSTLTQQLAKNLYLTEDRTLARKIREAILAAKLELTYSKQEILGMYLNTIYLGHGTYGVEVASQTYFGKPARELTLGEAALLAGLPRSPEYYSPFNNLQESIGRRNLVLSRMADRGFISTADAAGAQQEPLPLATPRSGRRTAASAPADAAGAQQEPAAAATGAGTAASAPAHQPSLSGAAGSPATR